MSSSFLVENDPISPAEDTGSGTTSLSSFDVTPIRLASAATSITADHTATDSIAAKPESGSTSNELQAARDQLTKLTESKITNRQELAEFKANMDKFENAAGQRRISPEQVQGAYEQMNRILSAEGDKPLSPQQRIEVAEQWMAKLADPTSGPNSVKQGWHSTGGYALAEFQLLLKAPDKATSFFADIVTEGKVVSINWKQEQWLEQQGVNTVFHTKDIPMKSIYIDENSMRPDREASGRNGNNRVQPRDFADQLMQVGLANFRFDYITPRDMEDPEKLVRGEIQCRYSNDFKGPDTPTQDLHNNHSEEQITCFNSSGNQTYSRNDRSPDFDSGNNPVVMNYLFNAIAAPEYYYAHDQAEPIVMAVDAPSSEELIAIKSQEELRTELTNRMSSGDFPVIALTRLANKGIIEPYLQRHPELTADKVSKDWVHYISVTSFDGKDTAGAYVVFGAKGDMTVARLYQAMGYPPGYTPPHESPTSTGDSPYLSVPVLPP